MKKTHQTIIIAVAVGTVCFYGGMKVGQGSKSSAGTQQANYQGGQRGTGGGGRNGLASGNGFTGGEILSKDANGITIKLRDGSSKIVLVSGSTPVMKAAQGSIADLNVGEQVTITGTQNSDGSITAQSVQIRPTGMGTGGPGGGSAPAARQ